MYSRPPACTGIPLTPSYCGQLLSACAVNFSAMHWVELFSRSKIQIYPPLGIFQHPLGPTWSSMIPSTNQWQGTGFLLLSSANQNASFYLLSLEVLKFSLHKHLMTEIEKPVSIQFLIDDQNALATHIFEACEQHSQGSCGCSRSFWFQACGVRILLLSSLITH